jgi:septal ring factor EnvC (AmiA/AmiB activator)
VSLFWMGLALLVAQDRRQILDELQGYDEQIGTLAQQVDALDTRAGTVETERKGHAEALAKAEADLAARRAETSHRLRAFYLLKRRGIARLLFDAESPTELRRRVRYLLALIRADEQRTRAYTQAVADQRTAAARVDADASALAGVQADLRTRMAALEAERAKRVALLHDIRSRPELASRVLEERNDAAEALGRSIAVVEATAPPAPVEAASFRAEKGHLAAPVAGSVIRGFGAYVDPASGMPATNLGVDYAAALGAPIRAVADGEVTRSGYLRGYGQMVMVQHGAYTTLYAHANGLRVAQGQAVHEGDVLGHVGNTGLAEDAPAELHFEIRYNNTPQDPAEWLARGH